MHTGDSAPISRDQFAYLLLPHFLLSSERTCNPLSDGMETARNTAAEGCAGLGPDQPEPATDSGRRVMLG
jgi:hypothetical protein